MCGALDLPRAFQDRDAHWRNGQPVRIIMASRERAAHFEIGEVHGEQRAVGAVAHERPLAGEMDPESSRTLAPLVHRQAIDEGTALHIVDDRSRSQTDALWR